MERAEASAVAANSSRAALRRSASVRKSRAVIARAFAPSMQALSPSSPPAQRANSGLWITTFGGAQEIIGWIDGTRWLTLPMSVLPAEPLGIFSSGKNVRPTFFILASYERASRSEESRVGQECGSTGRYRWSPYHEKKKTNKN